MTNLFKTLIFTVLVPGTVAVYVPYRIVSSGAKAAVPGIGPSSVGGVVLILAGTFGYFWCAWDFALKGRGTPAPIDPPKILVARGLYKLVRNPMYVSVTLVLVGECLLFVSWNLLVYALCAWFFFHLFVLLYEEPTLRKKFGGSYEEYCKAVPRWIPRLTLNRNGSGLVGKPC